MYLNVTTLFIFCVLGLCSCAGFKQNTSGKKATTKIVKTAVKPKKVVPTVVSPSAVIIPPPSLVDISPNVVESESTQVRNDTGLYADLKNADAPATREEVTQEVEPIVTGPTNIIIP